MSIDVGFARFHAIRLTVIVVNGKIVLATATEISDSGVIFNTA